MRIMLAGAGGYGTGYVREILKRTDVTFEGIVDPFAEKSAVWPEIQAADIPVFDTMDAFYASHGAELAVIAAPTFLHREYSINALSHGSNVLCEKPGAPTERDVRQMQEAEKEYGGFIGIGFQWSYSAAILTLKRDILSGRLGRPEKLRTFISWPRNHAYYRNRGWGGRLSINGEPLLDSIASNACGHYLHNMLFVQGPALSQSAEATSLRGACLRANDIESFDTCALLFTVDTGAECLFIASHAAGRERDPEFVYTFSEAEVRFGPDTGGHVKAFFRDGSEKDYGDPFEGGIAPKLAANIEACRTWKTASLNKNEGAGEGPVCGTGTALPHVKAVEMIHREIPIRNFPAEAVREDPDFAGVYVPGLYEKLAAMYESGKLESLL